MSVMTVSSREFNQDTSRAKRAALEGPVFITDRGKPAHVLLSIEEYYRLAAGRSRIADALAFPGAPAAEMEIPARTDLARSAELS